MKSRDPSAGDRLSVELAIGGWMAMPSVIVEITMSGMGRGVGSVDVRDGEACSLSSGGRTGYRWAARAA